MLKFIQVKSKFVFLNNTKIKKMSEKQKQKEIDNNGLYKLLPTVLDEMTKYIEEKEQQIEWECVNCRSLEELKEANDMPDIYYKLISLKNGI